ncbi:MAG: amidase family protein, partial [Xanthobacteraceae bacterium]
AALCLRPDGLDVVPEVIEALEDAGRRLQAAGWTVEKIDNTPPLKEAAELQRTFWLGDGYEAMLAAAEKEGDPGALACLRGSRAHVHPLDAARFSAILQRRAALTRDWQLFLQDYPVLVLPVSGELPFPDQLDLKDDASFARVWRAQMPQVGIPFMGLPGLTVTTGLVGRVPVGVQVVAGRYREDLCLAAGEAIEAGGTPSSPVDPL